MDTKTDRSLLSGLNRTVVTKMSITVLEGCFKLISCCRLATQFDSTVSALFISFLFYSLKVYSIKVASSK